MAHVAQMLMQEPIYKSSSVFCFKPILISAHKLILLIYGDNSKALVAMGLLLGVRTGLVAERGGASSPASSVVRAGMRYGLC